MEYTSYAEMTDAEYAQFLEEFYAVNGCKPDDEWAYDYQDFVEDSINVI